MPVHGGNRARRTVSRGRRPANRKRVVGNRTGRTTSNPSRQARTLPVSGRRPVRRRVSESSAGRPVRRGRNNILTRSGAGNRRPVRRGRISGLKNNRRGGNIICNGQLMSCPTNYCTGDCTTLSMVRQSMIR